MSWFKKKEQRMKVSAIDNASARVEIEARSDAKKEAVEQAREASKQLNTLLVENGFTIKIYLAAGGTKHKVRKK